MIRAVASILLLVVVSACGPGEGGDATEPLVGQWERAESTFTSLDGMVIEVQGDGSTAIIATVPDNEFGFVAGDVKWRNIEVLAENEYSFEDLVREEGSGATSYVEGVITVGSEGNTLEMDFPTTGTVQEWVRVEGS